jgi:hypothetical protein
MPTIDSNPNAWLDWLTVFGYIAFAGFITWKVMTTKQK